MLVHFWGTRGSLPYSVRTQEIRKKIHSALTIAVEHDLSETSELGSLQ
jgi:hypothetical protein